MKFFNMFVYSAHHTSPYIEYEYNRTSNMLINNNIKILKTIN